MTLTRDLDPWPWLRPLTLTLKQGNSEVKAQFLACDLDLWPTTFTYNPNLAKVQVDPHTKNQGQRSNGSNRRARIYTTDGRTDGRMNERTDGWTLPSTLSAPRFANDNKRTQWNTLCTGLITDTQNCYSIKQYRSILSLMGQKTISWCLTSFLFLAYNTSKLTKPHVVVIFFSKIFHWGGQNYTLEWIKVGNNMMSDTTNGPSNWELVTDRDRKH